MRSQNTTLKSKRSQVTVFIIIAIVIVGVLLILFLPNIKTVLRGTVPDVELASCLEENVQEAMDIVMVKGGSVDPGLYYTYEGENIEYLCYTRDYYNTCIMQKPLLKQSIEREVEAYVQPRVEACVNDLKNKLESAGYTIEAKGTNEVDVRFVPNNVLITIDLDMKLEKEGNIKTYEKFSSEIYSESYNMIMIASSISSWEAHYGDTNPSTYMTYYHNLKVQKQKQSDGTTIYIIEDLNTEEKLQFASRSVVWPAGYAV